METYVLTPLQTKHHAIKEINRMFFKFLWNDKGNLIKREGIINEYSGGGLKTINITTFNKSLKATWIKKYPNTENSSKWNFFFT